MVAIFFSYHEKKLVALRQSASFGLPLSSGHKKIFCNFDVRIRTRVPAEKWQHAGGLPACRSVNSRRSAAFGSEGRVVERVVADCENKKIGTSVTHSDVEGTVKIDIFSTTENATCRAARQRRAKRSGSQLERRNKRAGG